MRTWTGLLLLALLVIYLPDLGHGFIKDDFVWIASNQASGLEGLLRPFTHAPDFYRPLVSLSFAANWWLFGAEPLGYGLTNLVLLLAAAGVLWNLALALGLPRGAALACCALWTLNFHGIGNGAPLDQRPHVAAGHAVLVTGRPCLRTRVRGVGSRLGAAGAAVEGRGGAAPVRPARVGGPRAGRRKRQRPPGDRPPPRPAPHVAALRGAGRLSRAADGGRRG